MRVIICGTQNCNNYMILNRAIQLSGIAGNITEVYTSNDIGIATMVEKWARERGIPCTQTDNLEESIDGIDCCITLLRDYVSILDRITRLCERQGKQTVIFCVERDGGGHDFLSGPYTHTRLKGDEDSE